MSAEGEGKILAFSVQINGSTNQRIRYPDGSLAAKGRRLTIGLDQLTGQPINERRDVAKPQAAAGGHRRAHGIEQRWRYKRSFIAFSIWSILWR